MSLLTTLLTGLLAAFPRPSPAPDLCVVQGDESAGAACATRRSADESDRRRLGELLARQDAALCGGQVEAALADFAPDFDGHDIHCDSAQQLVERWLKVLAAFRAEHADVRVATALVAADRLGDRLVASVRHVVSGARNATPGAARDEDSVAETLVVRDGGGALRIEAIYDRDESRERRLDRATRRYDAIADLGIAVRWPEPFVPVARAAAGAALDELLLLDPADGAKLGLIIYDPTVDWPLADLLYSDIACPSGRFLVEPKRFDRAPAAAPIALEAEYEHPPEAARAGAPAAEPTCERAVYLSPDRRIVFAFWLSAPSSRFRLLKGKVDELARSLFVDGVRAGVPYHSALLERHPEWRTVGDDGVFRPAQAPIELPIPSGLAPTPLIGDRIVRLRLRLLEDLSSTIIVRVFPSGSGRIPAKSIQERSIQRMVSFACAEGRGGDSKRLDGVMDVLGQHGDWSGVEIACPDGTRRNWQIVAVDSGDCHVQVQVLPGSNKTDLQTEALHKVLAALRPQTPAANAAAGDGAK